MRDQIEDQRSGRAAESFAALNTYCAAIEDFYNDLRIAVESINHSNALASNGIAHLIDDEINVYVDAFQRNFLPKECPSIILDWYYLAKVPPPVVDDLIQLRKIIRASVKSLQTFEIFEGHQGQLYGVKLDWQILMRQLHEDFQRVSDLLSRVDPNQRHIQLPG